MLGGLEAGEAGAGVGLRVGRDVWRVGRGLRRLGRGAGAAGGVGDGLPEGVGGVLEQRVALGVVVGELVLGGELPRDAGLRPRDRVVDDLLVVVDPGLRVLAGLGVLVDRVRELRDLLLGL